MRKITVIIALFLAAIQIASAQKVGLVLSGGGAKRSGTYRSDQGARRK